MSMKRLNFVCLFSGPISFTRLISQLSLQKQPHPPSTDACSSSPHLKSILKKEPVGDSRAPSAAYVMPPPEPAVRKINNRGQAAEAAAGSPAKEKKIYYTTFKQPDIVYTNLDNLEETIRQQQAQLLQQQHLLQQQQQREQQQYFSLVRSNSRGAPVFKAPPPPSLSGRVSSDEPTTNDRPLAVDRLTAGSGQGATMAVNGHEQSTSFMNGSGDEARQWEWKVKIRPDGSRYGITVQ